MGQTVNAGEPGDSPGHRLLFTTLPTRRFTGRTAPPEAAVGNESWFVGDSRALGTSPGVGPPTRGTLAELEEDLARNFAGRPAVSLPLGVASGCASPPVVAAAPSLLQICCPSSSSPRRASGGGRAVGATERGEKRKRKKEKR